MAIELLLGRKVKPPEIGQAGTGALLLELDLAVSEEHSYRNAVSSYPVEEGLDITDHVRAEPERLTLEGFVTNAPIKYLAALRDNPITSGAGKDRVVTAYEVLLGIAGYKMVQPSGSNWGGTALSKPVLVDIYTSLRVYTDMILETLTVPRDNGTGDALRFKAEFVKIRKVSTQATTIRYTNEKKYGSGGANDQAQDTVDNGKKAGTEAPADKRTILKQMVDGGKKQLDNFFGNVKQQTVGQ